MIRLYAYYSCGGYKDMYLGSSDTAASPSYFLPLLPVMKKRGRTDEVEKNKISRIFTASLHCYKF